MIYILLPKTDELLIPVFIYGLSLIGMACIARLRQGRTNSKSYRYVLIGTLLFLISDSLLAPKKIFMRYSLGWNMNHDDLYGRTDFDHRRRTSEQLMTKNDYLIKCYLFKKLFHFFIKSLIIL